MLCVDRMPVPIGTFLSARMYNGRLHSQHKITDKSACKFVDVNHGEETRAGNSWKVRGLARLVQLSLSPCIQNEKEAVVAVDIAKRLHAQGQKFRIITPYDGQRALIEARLKSSGAPWEDKVFCVDSFQGKSGVGELSQRLCVSVGLSLTSHFRKRRRPYHHFGGAFGEGGVPA